MTLVSGHPRVSVQFVAVRLCNLTTSREFTQAQTELHEFRDQTGLQRTPVFEQIPSRESPHRSERHCSHRPYPAAAFHKPNQPNPHGRMNVRFSKALISRRRTGVGAERTSARPSPMSAPHTQRFYGGGRQPAATCRQGRSQRAAAVGGKVPRVRNTVSSVNFSIWRI
jgi:hypothetical protein